MRAWRSPLRMDGSDLVVILQTEVILGLTLLIIGSLMLTQGVTASSFGASLPLMLAVSGSLLAIIGALSLRWTKGRLAEIDAEGDREEWRRFLIAASTGMVISIALVMLNIKLELTIGFPLAVFGMFLFWQFVLGKRKRREC